MFTLSILPYLILEHEESRKKNTIMIYDVDNQSFYINLIVYAIYNGRLGVLCKFKRKLRYFRNAMFVIF